MPTNLPPEALKKWDEYSRASTPEEKFIKLREFYALIPKHKGTEKLEKFIRRRMSELRKEIERQRAARSKRGIGFTVEKRGAAQLVLIGCTNSGRSTLLSLLTNARPEISSAPYTTVNRPEEGMMEFSGAKIQIVEAPPLVVGGGRLTNLAMTLAYNADALGIVVNSHSLEDLGSILEVLSKHSIEIRRPEGFVRIKRSRAAPGIIIRRKGILIDCKESDVRELLRRYGVRNAYVDVEGRVRLSDVESALFREIRYKPSVLFVSRGDLLNEENLKLLRSRYNFFIDIVPFTSNSIIDKEDLGKKILDALGLIRIYTRNKMDKEASDKALIVKRGSTALDVARIIHEELYRRFRYAKVWSERLPYSPMRIGPDFELEDGDLIEIVC